MSFKYGKDLAPSPLIHDPEKKRPTKYSDELMDYILSEVASGKSVAEICRLDGMPSRQSFFKWMREKPGLVDRYAVAKMESCEVLVDEMLNIADNSSEDWRVRRLQIDTRKWVASKLKPNIYGEKIFNNHEGSIATTTVSDLTDDELLNIATRGSKRSPKKKKSKKKPN